MNVGSDWCCNCFKWVFIFNTYMQLCNDISCDVNSLLNNLYAIVKIIRCFYVNIYLFKILLYLNLMWLKCTCSSTNNKNVWCLYSIRGLHLGIVEPEGGSLRGVTRNGVLHRQGLGLIHQSNRPLFNLEKWEGCIYATITYIRVTKIEYQKCI